MKYAVALLLAFAPLAHADVVESTPASLKIKVVFTTTAPPERAWQSFVDIAKWWSSEHTFSGRASNLHLDARPGGCWCETLPNGGGVQHMVVVMAAPRERLTLSGALGPLQTAGVAGAMTFQFAPSGSGTQVTFVYDVGGHYSGGLDSVAKVVDQVLSTQMARLKRLLDTGSADEPPQKP